MKALKVKQYPQTVFIARAKVIKIIICHTTMHL
jgi:hypothetical protein